MWGVAGGFFFFEDGELEMDVCLILFSFIYFCVTTDNIKIYLGGVFGGGRGIFLGYSL